MLFDGFDVYFLHNLKYGKGLNVDHSFLGFVWYNGWSDYSYELNWCHGYPGYRSRRHGDNHVNLVM